MTANTRRFVVPTARELLAMDVEGLTRTRVQILAAYHDIQKQLDECDAGVLPPHVIPSEQGDWRYRAIRARHHCERGLASVNALLRGEQQATSTVEQRIEARSNFQRLILAVGRELFDELSTPTPPGMAPSSLLLAFEPYRDMYVDLEQKEDEQHGSDSDGGK